MTDAAISSISKFPMKLEIPKWLGAFRGLLAYVSLSMARSG